MSLGWAFNGPCLMKPKNTSISTIGRRRRSIQRKELRVGGPGELPNFLGKLVYAPNLQPRSYFRDILAWIKEICRLHYLKQLTTMEMETLVGAYRTSTHPMRVISRIWWRRCVCLWVGTMTAKQNFTAFHVAIGLLTSMGGSLPTFSWDILRLERFMNPKRIIFSVIDVYLRIFKTTTPGLTSNSGIAPVRDMIPT